ncbi:MAG: metallophosphoesterase [Gammaproteobacteria bacterium]|nr:metallophosphoesterase [Gammaproteobacteria bacterium]
MPGHSASGNRLFSIAVVSDTHLNSVEDDANTVFPVNRYANPRLRRVIEDLNLRDIERVFHLGDVVHPVPSAGESYEQASKCFFEQIELLDHPIHIIPGNHDVGDKPLPWAPSGTIRQSFADAYSKCFGEHYFALRQQGIVFVGINAQLFGSGIELETEQMQWLKGKLNECMEDRVFLFSHYPPYLLDVDEPEHYDNLSLESRRAFLNLLDAFGVEALFAGHVHHFWYNRCNQCNIYVLPSTAFTRQDYSEMFRVSPGNQFGRDDQPKLGYFLVHVFEQGHEFEFIRCVETQVKAGHPDRRYSLAVNRYRSRSETRPVLGIELRDDWQDLACIPPSGALDEFDRKTVRNDYALLALWDMGIQRIKITVSDLIEERRRKRLEELVHLGFRFTLYSFEPSDRKILELVLSNAHLIESWELAGEPESCYTRSHELKSKGIPGGIRLFFSPLKRRADAVRHGKKYYHVINHGFSIEDFQEDAGIDLARIASCFDGIALQCGLDRPIERAINLANDIKSRAGISTSLQLRLRAEDPSMYLHNEQTLCNRIAESMILAWPQDDCRVFCDTLADVDRGYFPRIGLVDRLYNPRNPARIVRHLHRLLNVLGAPLELNVENVSDQCRRITCEAEFGTLAVQFHSNNTESVPADSHDAGKSGLWLNWSDGTLVSDRPSYGGLPAAFILGYDAGKMLNAE